MTRRNKLDFAEPTQMEIDLGKHLKRNIYKALEDFVDTAEIAKLQHMRSATLALAILIDIALAGLLAIKMPQKQIMLVFKERLEMSIEKRNRD